MTDHGSRKELLMRCQGRRGARGAVLLATMAFISCCSAANAAEFSGGVIKIGVINDKTGPLSDINGP